VNYCRKLIADIMEKVTKNLGYIRSHWRRVAVGVILSAFVLAGRVYTVMQRTHPRRLLIPATLAQIVLLLVSMQFGGAGRGLYFFAAGTFTIVGLIVWSSTFPRPQYHWIRASDPALET